MLASTSFRTGNVRGWKLTPMTSNTTTDIIILGAGAAGLMCAIAAGKRGRSVLILERNDRVGKKIRISGGGRCNFTNTGAGPDNFLSQNPHFAKSALARYTPRDFCALVRAHNIAFHEKKLGQLFCDHSAQDIIDMLKKECDRVHVQILPGRGATKIIKKDSFCVTTPQGEYRSQSLVVASGGLSIPSLGATDFGYRLARQFGLRIVPCRPGLVPLTWAPKDLSLFKPLSGVSVPAEVRTDNRTFAENVLFTHKGLSGPAILQISSYWKPGNPIEINLLPGQDIVALLEKFRHKKTLLKNFLADFLPTRLAEILCAHLVPNKPLNQYTDKEVRHIADALGRWTIIPKGTEGYAKAEVTVGGIDTDELSSKTMEAKKVPGLHFIGEVVDVSGQLGGFNFQWAWSSGTAAGQYA